MNQRSNKKIIFSEHASDIICELLEKYKIDESAEQILDKMVEEIEPNGRKIANLLQEIVHKKFSKKDLSFELAKRLNISAKEAIDLSKDLQEKILFPMEDTSSEGISQVKEITIKKSKDIYQEPID